MRRKQLFVGFLLTFVTGSLCLTDCPSGYAKYVDTCFNINLATLNQTDAVMKCQDEGGTLALPKTNEMSQFLTAILNRYTGSTFWLGMQNSSSGWQWAGGGGEVSWTHWYPGYPNPDPDKEWTVVDYQGFWFNELAYVKHPYVCQLKLDAQPGLCSTKWHFIGSGYIKDNDDKSLTVSTVAECLSACQRETSFVCKSVDMFHDSTTCRLSSTGLSPSVEFVVHASWDYYQLHCEFCSADLVSDKASLPDSAFSASSESAERPANQSRLYLQYQVDTTPDLWGAFLAVAATTDTKQWLQIDFGRQVKITSVALQGGGRKLVETGQNFWVTSYRLLYSNNGLHWQWYRRSDSGRAWEIPGNDDRVTQHSHVLEVPIVAQMLRVNMRTFTGSPTFRFGAFGCETFAVDESELIQPLGMENRDIIDAQIRGSTTRIEAAKQFPPWAARINNEEVIGQSDCKWAPKTNVLAEWLQVDLLMDHIVTAVEVQGSCLQGLAENWVTIFSASSSLDGESWMTYSSVDGDMEFQGPFDQETRILVALPARQARYFRLSPMEYFNHMTVRMEVHGRPVSCPAIDGEFLSANMTPTVCSCSLGSNPGALQWCPLSVGDSLHIKLGKLYLMTDLKMDTDITDIADITQVAWSTDGEQWRSSPLSEQDMRVTSLGTVVTSSFRSAQRAAWIRLELVGSLTTGSCMSLTLHACPAQACPPGYVYRKEWCYLATNLYTKLTSEREFDICNGTQWVKPAYLASPSDLMEEVFLQIISKLESTYLGFAMVEEKDPRVAGVKPKWTYYQLDGRNTTYSNWDGNGLIGQPDEFAPGEVIAFHWGVAAGRWHDYVASSVFLYSCSTPASVDNLPEEERGCEWFGHRKTIVTNHDVRSLTNVPSSTVCMEECMKEANFTCLSVEYSDSLSNGHCILSDAHEMTSGISMASSNYYNYYHRYCPESNETGLIWTPGGVGADYVTMSAVHSGNGPEQSPLNNQWRPDQTSYWAQVPNVAGHWFQVDFRQVVKVNRVIIRGGGYDYNCWISAYRLHYSNTSLVFHIHQDQNGNNKGYTGAIDSEHAMPAKVEPAIFARFLRLYPTNWATAPCLRWEVEGVPQGDRQEPAKGCFIDVQSYGGNDAFRSAWMFVNGVDYWPDGLTQGLAILQINMSNNTCGIVANGTHAFNWLLGTPEIDRLRDWVNSSEWIETSILVGATIDTAHFTDPLLSPFGMDLTLVLKESIAFIIQPGSPNSVTYRKTERYYGGARLIQEVGQTEKDDLQYHFLGAQDQETLPLSQISVSRSLDTNWEYDKIRMFDPRSSLFLRNAWVGGHAASDFVQIDLILKHVVTGIVLKGDGSSYYVKSFKVAHGEDGLNWIMQTDNDGIDKIYGANYDATTVLIIELHPAVTCRYIRVHPMSWSGYAALKIELTGYPTEYPSLNEALVLRSVVQTSASSDHSGCTAAQALNSNAPCDGWCVQPDGSDIWWEVDLGQLYLLTQLNLTFNTAVTSINMLYGTNSSASKNVKQTWQTNGGNPLLRIYKMIPLLRARYLKINLINDGSSKICMQVFLYGEVASACPPKFMQYKDQCFYNTLSSGTSAQAEYPCSQMPWVTDSELFIPTNRWQQNSVATWLKVHPTQPRVGIQKIGSKWYWTDGSEATDAVWYAGHPGGYPCGCLYSSAAIGGCYCHYNHPAMCRTKASVPADEECEFSWIHHPSVLLNTDSVGSVTGVWLTDCFDACLYHRKVNQSDPCRAINYLKASLTCNLLAVTWEEAYSTYTATANAHYFEIRLECHGNCSTDLMTTYAASHELTLSASSMASALYSPDQAFLDAPYGWRSGTNSIYEWVELSFVAVAHIHGIITQAVGNGNHYTTLYRLLYEDIFTGMWRMYADPSGNTMTFPGNPDRYGYSVHMLGRPFYTQIMRIHTIGRANSYALRLEVIGCIANITLEKPPCISALGVESKLVRDYQLKAKSYYVYGATYNMPQSGRLNHQPSGPHLGSWWPYPHTDVTSWIQVDLAIVHRITGIITQGDATNQYWVKEFYLSFSLDHITWTEVKDKLGNTLKYAGNFANTEAVLHQVDTYLETRYLRLHPTNYYGRVALRFDVIGCSLSCGTSEEEGLTPIINQTVNSDTCKGVSNVFYSSSIASCDLWCSPLPGPPPTLQVDLQVVFYLTSLTIYEDPSGSKIHNMSLIYQRSTGENATETQIYLQPNLTATTVQNISSSGRLMTTYMFEVALLLRFLTVDIIEWTSDSEICFSLQLRGCYSGTCASSMAQFGENCYLFHTPSLSQTWTAARDDCIDVGDSWTEGNLPSLDYKETRFVAGLHQGQTAWYGGYLESATWEWVGGGNSTPHNWYTVTAPSDVTKPYMYGHSTSGYWYNGQATLKKRPVCQSKASILPATVGVLKWMYMGRVRVTGTLVGTSVPYLTVTECLRVCQDTGTTGCLAVKHNKNTKECVMFPTTRYSREMTITVLTSSQWEYWERFEDGLCSESLLYSPNSTAAVTASSTHSSDHGTDQLQPGSYPLGSLAGYWMPDSGDSTPWLYVEFLQMVTLTRIRTRGSGRYDTSARVTGYKLEYSSDSIDWYFAVNDETQTEVFTATWNQYDIRDNQFVITSRLFKIHIESWATSAALQFDLLGCILPGVITCKDSSEPLNVIPGVQDRAPLRCDNQSTLVLYHSSVDFSFARPWTDYLYGFSSTTGPDYWMGVHRLYHVSSSTGMKLRVEMWGPNGEFGNAEFSLIVVKEYPLGYQLKVGSYQSGTSGNGGLNSYHRSARWYTYDGDTPGGCAATFSGGWWYWDNSTGSPPSAAECFQTKLTGEIGATDYSQGAVWGTDGELSEEFTKPLSKVVMKIRDVAVSHNGSDVLGTPCRWNEECLVNYSTCGVPDGNYSDSFTCICGRYYVAHDEHTCIPLADIVPNIDNITAGVEGLVRSVTTTVTFDLDLQNAFGRPFLPVSSGHTNFVIDILISSEDIGVQNSTTDGNSSMVVLLSRGPITGYDTVLTAGLYVGEFHHNQFDVDITVPADLCHYTNYICVNVTSGDVLTYYEFDSANNINCVSIKSILQCQPAIDLTLSSIAYPHTDPIIRSIYAQYEFALEVGFTFGSHDVMSLGNSDWNYEIQYLISDVNGITNATFAHDNNQTVKEPYSIGAIHTGDVALVEGQKGVVKLGTNTIMVHLGFNMTIDVCQSTQYLCVYITNGPLATFKEANPEDNVYCYHAVDIMICSPEIEIDVELFTTVESHIFVRGYDDTTSFTISMENLNDTLEVARVSPPQTNFNITLYYADHDMRIAPGSGSTVIGPDVGDIMDDLGTDLPIKKSKGYLGTVDAFISRDTCDAISHMCGHVVPGLNASYSLNPGTSHIRCTDISSQKNCIGVPVTGLVFESEPEIAMVNSTVNITVGWDEGTDVNYTIMYGGGFSFTWNWLEQDHTKHYKSMVTYPNHNYTIIGNFTIQLDIGNDADRKQYELNVTIEPSLQDYVFIDVDYTPQASPFTARFYVSRQNHIENVAPIYIWCTAEFGEYNLTFGPYSGYVTVDSFNITHNYTSDDVNATAKIHCENHVSVIDFETVMTLRANFTSVAISPNHTAWLTNEVLVIYVSMATGSHAWIVMDVGDGNLLTEQHPDRLSYSSPFTMTHTYTLVDNFTISAELYNEIYRTHVTYDKLLIIQNEVKGLSLNAPALVAIPGQSTDFTIVSDTSIPVPTHVFCNYSLKEGTLESGIYSSQLSQGLDHIHSIQYTRDDIGHAITINITCYNLASSQSLNHILEVLEPITFLHAEAHSLHFSPHETSNITVSVKSGSSVSYSVSYGDGRTNNYAHPKLFAVHETMNVPVNYTAIGNYSVVVTASNKLGSESYALPEDLVIQNDITNLTISSNESVLWPPGEVLYIISTGSEQKTITDMHCEWNYGQGLIRNTFTETANPAEHLYFTELFSKKFIGWVNATVNCYNLISSLSLETHTLVIFDEVILASLRTNGTVLWTNTTEVILDIERFGTWSCFAFDMGDGSEGIIYGGDNCAVNATHMNMAHQIVPFGTMELIHEYIYPDFGRFEVKVFSFNHVSNHTLTTTAIVLDWPCEYPNISLPEEVVDETVPWRKMRSEMFEITPNISIDCMKTGMTDILWQTFVHGDTSSPMFTLENNKTFVHEMRMFPYGFYDFHIRVAMHNVEGIETTEIGYLEIYKTPLKVYIVGGLETSVGYNKTFIMDAMSLTFDPDVEPDDKQGLTYAWYCREDSEEFPMNGNQLSDSVVRYQSGVPLDGGGCFGTGTGKLEFTEGKFTIDSLGMYPAKWYVFRVVVRKDTREGYFDQKVFVKMAEPPVLSVSCSQNCKDRARSAGEMAYRVTCLENCYSLFGPVEYHWRLFVYTEKYKNFTEWKNFENITVDGLSKDRVFIKANALVLGQEHMIMIDGWTPGSLPGSANETFLVNLPPYGGSCSIDPLEGYAAETYFLITCMDWKEWMTDNPQLSFEYRIQQKGSKRSFLLFYGSEPVSAPLQFPVGNHMEDFLSEVVVVVIDSITDEHQYVFDVKVWPPPRPALDLVGQLLGVSNGEDPELSNLMTGGDYQTAAVKIFSTTSLLNVPSNLLQGFENATEEQKAAIQKQKEEARANLIMLCSTIPVNGSGALDQNNAVLWSLLLVAEEVALFAQVTGSDRLNQLTGNYVNLKQEQPPERSKMIAGDLVDTSIRLMIAADIKGKEMLGTNGGSKTNNSMTTAAPVTESTNATDEVIHVMKGILTVVDDISQSLNEDKNTGDPNAVIAYDEATLVVGKQQGTNLDNSTIATKQGDISFPQFPSYESVDMKIMFSDINPFLWDPSATNIKSAVIYFDLKTNDTDGDFAQNSSSHGQRRRRRSINSPSQTLASSLDIELVTKPIEPALYVNASPVDVYAMAYRAYNVSDAEKPVPVQVVVHPYENDTLEVYLHSNNFPTPDDYMHQVTVPIDNSVNKTNGTGPAEQLYTITVPTANLTNGTLFVGIRKTGVCNLDAECGKSQTQEDRDFMYSIQFLETPCQIWDTDKEIWIKGECDIHPDSTPERVRFKSNLMGSIGVDVFVGPNMIDFGTVFDDFGAKLIENMPVVATVIGVIILYIPLAILCRRLDKKDKLKFGILPLVDNYYGDKCLYEIHVYTGFHSNAGTDSKVSIVLTGTEGDSGIRGLQDGYRKNFQRGEVNSFLMCTPYLLGTLHGLRVWHDNSGKGQTASWFLSKIVVIDKQNNNWYVFTCGQWLAVDKGDGLLSRMLRTSTFDTQANSGLVLRNNINRKLLDDHLWLSVGIRKAPSSFTRLQRLSTCLALLFLSMVANAMWYKTEGAPDSASGIRLGPVLITLHMVYTSLMSSLIVVPVIVVIAALFTRSKARPKKNADSKEATSDEPLSPNRTFPFWGIYIAWMLVFFSVAAAAFFTILYSFQWGGVISTAWITSFFLSFFQSVMLIQPLQVFILAAVLTFILHRDLDTSLYQESLGKSSQEDEDVIIKEDDLAAIMLSADEREHAKRTQDMEGRVRILMKEILFQSLFLILLLIVVLGNRDGSVYDQNMNLAGHFQKSHKVTHYKALLPWLSSVVLPELYLEQDYNGVRQNDYDEKFIENRYAMRMGPPRLRQLRVTPEECIIPGLMKPYISRCNSKFKSRQEEVHNYYPGWQTVRNMSDEKLTYLEEAFVHKTSAEIDGVEHQAFLQMYPGGGYIGNLGNTLTDALDLVKRLEEAKWIDHLTRAVFISTDVYNANTGLFTSYTAVFEFPSMGGVFWWQYVESVFLYRYTGSAGLLAILTELLCVVVFLVILVKELINIFQSGVEYFAQFWNIVQIIILMFFALATCLYAARSVWTTRKIEQMMNNKGDTVNFQIVTSLNNYFLLFMGLTTYLVIIQFLHILRYNHTIGLLTRTLGQAAPGLSSMLMCLGIAYASFGSYGIMLYGSETRYFSSVGQIVATFSTGLLGAMDDELKRALDSHAGRLFILSYMLTFLILIMDLFITLLNEFLAAVKNDKASIPKDHEVIEHLMESLKAFIAGEKEEKPSQKQKPPEEESGKNEDDLQQRLDFLNDLLDALAPTPSMDMADIVMDYMAGTTYDPDDLTEEMC